jgi:hypothetical protein
VALIDLERAILAVCFRAEPPAALLEELGDRDRWLIYREMVRDRLARELRVALPRTCALIGESLIEHEFTAYLELDPPRTRYFRGVVAAFVQSARSRWLTAGSIPAAAIDLASYELALWEVGDLAVSRRELQEFSFDRAPAVSQALRLLHVQHAVHLPADCGAEPGEYFLCVHRRDDRAPVRTWTLTASTFELLSHFSAGQASASAIVRRLAAARGASIDAHYVDALCATLAQFLELGIVLGSI